MRWFLNETVEKSAQQIQHGDTSLFLGSCFSENIFEKGKFVGMDFQNSGFGTLFHPIPMARILQDAILFNSVQRIIERDNRFYSWDGYSKFNAESKSELFEKIQQERIKISENLIKAKFLFITFGTSKGYKNSEGLVVANCHKLPATNFTSELTDLSEMTHVFKKVFTQLKKINPILNIVLTVSPVRHSKDGLVTNNRSKSRLLRLCEELEKIDQVSYFPAYEMVMDELRDHRFFQSDLVHPNEDALKYVWDKFKETFFSLETKKLIVEIEKYRAFFNHVPNSIENEEERILRLKKEDELKTFLGIHPEINWK